MLLLKLYLNKNKLSKKKSRFIKKKRKIKAWTKKNLFLVK